MYKKISIYSILVIFIDQIIKIIINSSLSLYQSKYIIKSFFSITNAHNTGAAWSILSNNRVLLIIIAIITLILIFVLFIYKQKLDNYDIIIYSLLIGGIIANLIDRILYGYVIDYLDFTIFKYNYPVFNFADICIVLSVFLLIIKTIKEGLCKKS